MKPSFRNNNTNNMTSDNTTISEYHSAIGQAHTKLKFTYTHCR